MLAETIAGFLRSQIDRLQTQDSGPNHVCYGAAFLLAVRTRQHVLYFGETTVQVAVIPFLEPLPPHASP